MTLWLIKHLKPVSLKKIPTEISCRAGSCTIKQILFKTKYSIHSFSRQYNVLLSNETNRYNFMVSQIYNLNTHSRVCIHRYARKLLSVTHFNHKNNYNKEQNTSLFPQNRKFRFCLESKVTIVPLAMPVYENVLLAYFAYFVNTATWCKVCHESSSLSMDNFVKKSWNTFCLFHLYICRTASPIKINN